MTSISVRGTDGWLSQLRDIVGKEAHLAPTRRWLVAQLGTVTRGMQPEFKQVVCIGARVSSRTLTLKTIHDDTSSTSSSHLFSILAFDSHITEFLRVSSTSFFSFMQKWTCFPVVVVELAARQNLNSTHQNPSSITQGHRQRRPRRHLSAAAAQINEASTHRASMHVQRRDAPCAMRPSRA